MPTKRSLLLPALVLVLAVAGCRTTRPTLEQLATINTVHVLPVVEKTVDYSGTLPSEYEVDQGNGLLSNPYTAPLGFFVELFSYSSTQKKRRQRLRQIFSEAKLDLPQTLHATFSERLARDGVFPVVAHTAEEGQAVIELQASYGVNGARFVDSEWSPWLSVVATLRDASGKEIWHYEAGAEAGDGAIRLLPFPDPFHDRSLLRQQYQAAVDVVSDALIRHLNGQDDE